MNIVLIGGSGFIGQRFAQIARLAKHDITIVSRYARPADATSEWIEGGIAALVRDPSRLAAADIVCHFASTSVPATSNADPVADVLENLVPNLKLLQAMREVGNKRIAYLSSGGAVYGVPRYSPIDETHSQWPISSYGIVKASMERYLSLYAEQYSFHPLVIRPSNPYGPGQDGTKNFGIVATLIALAKVRGEATLYGDGSIVRDFIFIDDLCNFILASIEAGIAGVYNCGSGQGTSLLDVLHAVEHCSGYKFRRRYLPARPIDPPAIVLNIDKAKRDLSWEPLTSFNDGVNQTWKAQIEQRYVHVQSR